LDDVTRWQTPGFIDELRQDIEEECGKIGEMAKLTIFEKHPEGVGRVLIGTMTEAYMSLDINHRNLLRLIAGGSGEV